MGTISKMSDWRPPSELREIDRRMKENADLIKRMKNNESLSRIPPAATHFPPRPVIEKDKAAIDKIFPNGLSNDRRKSE